jgi:hypothetical protein
MTIKMRMRTYWPPFKNILPYIIHIFVPSCLLAWRDPPMQLFKSILKMLQLVWELQRHNHPMSVLMDLTEWPILSLLQRSNLAYLSTSLSFIIPSATYAGNYITPLNLLIFLTPPVISLDVQIPCIQPSGCLVGLWKEHQLICSAIQHLLLLVSCSQTTISGTDDSQSTSIVVWFNW